MKLKLLAATLSLYLLYFNAVNAQVADDLELGVSVLITQVNIKESLFVKESILSGDELYSGYEITLNKKVKNNLRFETGLEFFRSRFFVISESTDFSPNQADQNGGFSYSIVDNNLLGEYSSQISYQRHNLDCNNTFSENQSPTIRSQRLNQVILNTIGIPLRIEYVVGKKAIQPFASIGITPSVYATNSLNFKERQLGAPAFHAQCGLIDNPEYAYKLSEINTKVTDRKLNNFFLSTFISAGIKHSMNRSVFKINAVYGGSNINFSNARDTDLAKEILAIRFSLGVKLGD